MLTKKKRLNNQDIQELLSFNSETISNIETDIVQLHKDIDHLTEEQYHFIREQVREELELPYRLGNKRRYLYKEVPSDWDSTFYTKYSSFAEKWGNITLSDSSLDEMKNAIQQYYFRHKDGKIQVVFVANCDTVIKSKHGPRLQLSDPYGTIVTEPLTLGMDYDRLIPLIGHILIVFATVSKDDIQSYHVTRIKRTMFDTDGNLYD